jgi:hypothetical protein
VEVACSVPAEPAALRARMVVAHQIKGLIFLLGETQERRPVAMDNLAPSSLAVQEAAVVVALMDPFFLQQAAVAAMVGLQLAVVIALAAAAAEEVVTASPSRATW